MEKTAILEFLPKKIATEKVKFPDNKPFPKCTDPMLHVMIEDEGFPLQEHLIRPYPRKLAKSSLTKQVYNYRHSRARRIVENCFGILAKRFRVYQRRLHIYPERMDIVVGATCCLHNFLRTHTFHWTSEEEQIITPTTLSLQNFNRIAGNCTTRAMEIRDEFADYFMSEHVLYHGK